jgi:hypothetical protein
MKKLMPLLILLIMLSTGLPAYADGIFINSDSGGKVGILDDIIVLKSSLGNVVTVIGDINVQGDVDGDVVAVFGDININARVTGQVVGVFGQIKLTERAEVKGDVISVGPVEKDPAARVAGQLLGMQVQDLASGMNFLTASRAVLVIVFSFLTLVFGLVLIALSGNKLQNIMTTMETNLMKKVILGFLALIGAFTLMIIFFITVIIPLAYFILVLLANIIAGIYFGRLILKAFSAASSTYLEFATGLITITLVKMLLIYLIPQGELIISGLVYLAFEAFINSLGIGIIIYSKFGRSGHENSF